MVLYLVEDERNIRESILSFVNWTSIGISLVKGCRNGKDALEQMEKNGAPDILITDVRMPIMDGIALANEVRAKYPDTMILFLSGYADKEYLMSAIRLEAFQYIEKPISIDDLTTIISNAANEWRKRNASKQEHKKLEAFKERNLTAVKKATLMSILSGTGYDSSGLFNVSEEYSLISSFYPQFIANPTEGQAFYETALSLFVDATLIAFDPKGILHMMIKRDLSNSYITLLRVGDLSRLSTRAYICFIENFDISKIDKAFLKTEYSFLEFLCFYQIEYSGDLNNWNPVPLKNNKEMIDRLDEVLMNSNSNSIKELLFSFNKEISAKKYDIHSVRQFYLDAYQHIQKHMFGTGNMSIDQYKKFESAKLLIDISNILSILVDSGSDMVKFKDPRIRNIINYVEDHIDDTQLSLNQIADVLGLSSNYISSYFAKEAGMSLGQFITEKRIKKAEKLLLGGNDKIQKIALKCGFPDLTYFSSVFKKNTGMSPAAYRKEKIHQ